jgi:glycerophosphoryl diester phosphodiesterase
MYAHRGLHNAERAENSMSAFKAAVEGGYGIELDIRLSRDGEMVVFHDDTLDRVCGREGRVIDFTADELATFKLSGTNDGIPRFSDVLALVDGKVPLLVEIKEDPGVSAVSEATCKMLKGYKGAYIVESFNPLSLRTVKKNMPEVSRGILSHRYYEYEPYRKPLYFLLQSLLLNFLCRPAFIAYDHRHAKAFGLRFARGFFRVPTLAWTVKSAEDEAEARKNGFDGIIFEGYLP